MFEIKLIKGGPEDAAAFIGGIQIPVERLVSVKAEATAAENIKVTLIYDADKFSVQEGR